MYGVKDTNTVYTVKVNDQIVENGIDELFAFTTDIALHGSCNISITVNFGKLALQNCTCTYPASFNGIDGTATTVQPIDQPVAIIKNGELITVPFDIEINKDDTFSYEHLMFNGPDKFIVTTNGIELFPGIDIDLGYFWNNNLAPGVLEVETEYSYIPKPNDVTSLEDLKKLKELVLKNASMEKLVYSRDLKSLVERHPGSTPGTRTIL